jgi:addiction module HigA family antidote
MPMHNPAHPGEVIRALCLDPEGLTVTSTAAALGVTRKALSDLLNGHSGVSPEMAIRLEKAGWSTADHWLRMQLQYDLWRVRRHADKIRVRRLSAAKPACTSAPPLRLERQVD